MSLPLLDILHMFLFVHDRINVHGVLHFILVRISLSHRTHTDTGGRVSPVSSDVTFFNHLSRVVGRIPLNLLSLASHDTSPKKKMTEGHSKFPKHSNILQTQVGSVSSSGQSARCRDMDGFHRNCLLEIQ
jgi:hypothetical protein